MSQRGHVAGDLPERAIYFQLDHLNLRAPTLPDLCHFIGDKGVKLFHVGLIAGALPADLAHVEPEYPSRGCDLCRRAADR